ncbi:MAG: DUF4380 domain-containing protein [Chloroflexi bacterium]|nr:DUF4380 domain-containing protein [Chloroflexota bacterium]MBU1750835.1 DUF4380 domain-containing protein [Chloroflexota bacterium]
MGDFHGLPTHIIANAHLRLEYLATAGPRIVRLFLAGSDENLLAETPDISWPTPYGKYFIRGGHRLWRAPEDWTTTYVPDNEGLTVEELPNGVCLSGPAGVVTGIRKSIEIRLPDDGSRVTLVHRLQNDGPEPAELAPWAITQLPLGGLAVLPLRDDQMDQPGPLPDRHLVLWPYTRWSDPRLQVDDELVWIAGQPDPIACKVGTLNHRGWLGYLRDGVFLLKRFSPQVDSPYPDRGCNAEVYCKDRFIELETLGPLCRLEPGQATTHVETWQVYADLDVPQTAEGLRALTRELGL